MWVQGIRGVCPLHQNFISRGSSTDERGGNEASQQCCGARDQWFHVRWLHLTLLPFFFFIFADFNLTHFVVRTIAQLKAFVMAVILY